MRSFGMTNPPVLKNLFFSSPSRRVAWHSRTSVTTTGPLILTDSFTGLAPRLLTPAHHGFTWRSPPPLAPYTLWFAPVMTHKISDNPIVTSTIKIWLQFRRHHGLHRASIQAPILNNHSFSPSCSDPTFRMWAANGLVTICQPNITCQTVIFSASSKLGILLKSNFPIFPTAPRVRNWPVSHPWLWPKKAGIYYLWKTCLLWPSLYYIYKRVLGGWAGFRHIWQ